VYVDAKLCWQQYGVCERERVSKGKEGRKEGLGGQEGQKGRKGSIGWLLD
jgi:hypothetical protein